MDPMLEKMCAHYCRRSLVITRNEESQALLSKLGVPTELGTDTAWTFEPHPADYGIKHFPMPAGTDERLFLRCARSTHFGGRCGRRLRNGSGGIYLARIRRAIISSVYFHNSGPAVDAAYAKYLASIASAVKAFRAKKNVFPVLVAMERLDARACEALAPQLGGIPVFTSDSHGMYELVSILRSCSMIVSSRYHAMVTSMPGLVPSAGITMDERIQNLLRDRGHENLLLTVEDPNLEAKLFTVMETLSNDAENIRQGIGGCVVRNLKTMARMGMYLERAVQERYPEFPTRSGVRGWEEYLPPLSPNLEKLLDKYENAAIGAAAS